MGRHDSTPHICPASPYSNATSDIVPLTGGLTFHHISLTVAGVCLTINCLASFFLIFRHATHFSIPQKQKQILRIIWTLPVFALVSFLSILFQDASIYLIPFKDLYMSLALVAFFLLLVAFLNSATQSSSNNKTFILPGPRTNIQYQDATLLEHEAPPVLEIPRRTAIAIYQFPPVMLFVFVVTEITEATGTYCANSNSIHFSHIWMTIITIISTILAIASLLRFYRMHKDELAHQKPLSKFIAFKGIVFLNFIQTTVFSLLESTSVLKPTKFASFDDLSVGVPAMILSIEMVFFSLAFLRVYRVTHYRQIGRNGIESESGMEGSAVGYQGGALGTGALIKALNISDILRGMVGVVTGSSGRRW